MFHAVCGAAKQHCPKATHSIGMDSECNASLALSKNLRRVILENPNRLNAFVYQLKSEAFIKETALDFSTVQPVHVEKCVCPSIQQIAHLMTIAQVSE